MEVPSTPLETLRMDLFLHNSKCFLLVADYYSKFTWVLELSATSIKDVISALCFSFPVPGTSEEVIWDNGSPFPSMDTKILLPSGDFPYYK